MSNFKHDRILSPLAITLVVDRTNQTPAIVLPIMTNGDLCRYLRKNKVFPIVKLLTFALQIAEGKCPIHSMHPIDACTIVVLQVWCYANSSIHQAINMFQACSIFLPSMWCTAIWPHATVC